MRRRLGISATPLDVGSAGRGCAAPYASWPGGTGPATERLIDRPSNPPQALSLLPRGGAAKLDRLDRWVMMSCVGRGTDRRSAVQLL